MEYTVILTQQPGAPWRAVVPGLPDCVVEAPSRIQALEEIRQSIISVVSRSEVLRIQVPVTPAATSAQPTPLSQTPWQWFGIFQSDPTWSALFDDVDRQRSNQVAGG